MKEDMLTRKVTEQDFRLPEFRDAVVEDYEFRADGKLVRKDRWERAVQSIRALVGISAREFEITEVVDAVRNLVNEQEGWTLVEDSYPKSDMLCSIRLEDGGCLRNAVFQASIKNWAWRDVQFSHEVVAWREEKQEQGTSI